MRHIADLFASQAGTRWTSPDGHVSADLTVGADDQDDCAVLEVGGASVVIGSDYIRGAQFHLFQHGYLNHYDIGWYLVGANVSDIAAMGATPMTLLTVIRYPKSMPTEQFNAVLEGIRDACAAVGALNVGGDIGTADTLTLSATATGLVTAGKALLRKTASAGDLVLVSGPTGIAGSALTYFRSPERALLSEQARAALLAPWRRVTPRVELGKTLSAEGLATACVDTSDGLKGAIDTLARSSQVGISIDQTALPIAAAVREVSAATSTSALDLVLGDSVDFELLFTVAPRTLSRATALLDDRGLAYHQIGVVTDSGNVVMKGDDGATVPLPGEAWNHT